MKRNSDLFPPLPPQPNLSDIFDDEFETIPSKTGIEMSVCALANCIISSALGGLAILACQPQYWQTGAGLGAVLGAGVSAKHSIETIERWEEDEG